MLRGCQKKIVFLKNTGSKLFDEAYFVISDKADSEKICRTDMITEANRIIDECIGDRDGAYKDGIFSKLGRIVKRGFLPFSLGVCLSLGVIIMFAILSK